ncbi:hypothetical protein ACLB2K_050740 [Fragaria x ananassa]
MIQRKEEGELNPNLEEINLDLGSYSLRSDKRQRLAILLGISGRSQRSASSDNEAQAGSGFKHELRFVVSRPRSVTGVAEDLAVLLGISGWSQRSASFKDEARARSGLKHELRFVVSRPRSVAGVAKEYRRRGFDG